MKAIKWVFCTAALVAAGCAPTKPTVCAPTPVMPASAQSPEDALRQRVTSLQDVEGDLAAQVSHLPGGDETEHRKLVVASFADLVRILPLLYGPTSSEQFAEQIRVIDSSRSQVESASPDLNANPTIDTGLRAVGRSLGDINRIAYANDPDVVKTLQQLQSGLEELDNVIGPEHRVVVANVFGSVVQVTQQLTGLLAQHVAPEAAAPAATEAATAPSTDASTATPPAATPAPASEPAVTSAPAATQP